MMDRLLNNLSTDKERMQQCIAKFNHFAEDMMTQYKEQKIINNFLADLYDASNHNVVLDDFDKVIKNIQIADRAKRDIMDNFI